MWQLRLSDWPSRQGNRVLIVGSLDQDGYLTLATDESHSWRTSGRHTRARRCRACVQQLVPGVAARDLPSAC